MKPWTKALCFLPAALHYGLIFALSAQSTFPFEAPFSSFDKLAHIGLYALLGVFLAFGMFKSTRLSPGRRTALTLAAGAALGVLDEIHQSYVPLRIPDILDVLADVGGIAAGLIAFVFLARAAARRGLKWKLLKKSRDVRG